MGDASSSLRLGLRDNGSRLHMISGIEPAPGPQAKNQENAHSDQDRLLCATPRRSRGNGLPSVPCGATLTAEALIGVQCHATFATNSCHDVLSVKRCDSVITDA